ncbi:O-antigen ligase family protein [Fulvivirga maritima]|uniref:O-antigen ligase family protein n=1 Tax=Fulvivirga maritima TaxID=2904247 RepID=UPI001F297968|nr:O-antigen ligase family protein [Fulvivirga maritima]UII27944.1 O-antigen ligase family protein [Fulvivirga maritima]
MERLYFLGLVCVAFVMPFGIVLSNISIIGLFIIWLIVKKRQVNAKQRYSILMFISLFIISVVGLIWTSTISKGLFTVEKSFALLLFPIIIGTGPKLKREQLIWVLLMFSVSVIIASCISLLDRLHFIYLTNRSLVTIFKYYNTHLNFLSLLGLHPTYFSLYLLFSMISLTIIFCIKDRPVGIPLIVLVIAILFITFIIYLCASRSIILITGLFVFLSFTLWLFRKCNILNATAVIFAIIVLSGFIIYNLPETNNTKKRFENLIKDNGSTSLRYELGESRFSRWKVILENYSEFYLVGVGTGDSQQFLNECYRENDLKNALRKEYNSHNQYLDYFIKYGVLGLIAFSLVLFLSLRHAYYKGEKLYLIFIVLIILVCMGESFFLRQKGVVFYSFFNSLLFFNSFKISD